jgi:flagellum-specific ATP synthase
MGTRCLIEGNDGEQVEAEVVGFADNRLFLMPTGNLSGVMPHARVIPTSNVSRVAAGDALLGRVIDGAGNPLDGRGPLHCENKVRLEARCINPLARQPICDPLDVGVRSINALFTIGRGQRLGLFSGSGIGKSSLLSMMTRFTKADVIVVGLIGERGREVKEFVEDNLGPEGLARSVVVATPADCSPLMRVHGAWVATSISEYFRDRGDHVLLLISPSASRRRPRVIRRRCSPVCRNSSNAPEPELQAADRSPRSIRFLPKVTMSMIRSSMLLARHWTGISCFPEVLQKAGSIHPSM